MAEPTDRPPRRTRSSTPADYPVTAPPQNYASGEYSYILEIVMNMQSAMGRLTEAVDSLKDQSKEQGKELKTVSSDVHAAKVVVSVVGAIVIGLLGFLGWVAKAYLDYLVMQPHKP